MGSVIKVNRKRPRITLKNSRHIKVVWDDSGKKDIFITYLINNYINWMGDVDIVYQQISYKVTDIRFC